MSNHKNISEEKVRKEIMRLSEEYHGGERPTVKTLKNKSEYTRKDVKKYFEKWSDALDSIGFGPRNPDYSHEKIERELYKVKSKVKRSPRIKDFKEESDISPFPISNKYGGWAKALIVHGIEPDGSQLKDIEEKEIINDFQNKVKETERVITSDEYREIGKYDVHTIQNKFGSWKNFVKECGHEPVGRPRREDHYKWNGGWERYYGESWNRQRKRARKRDQYRCQVCHKSESELGRKPDVHHINPTYNFNVEDEHELMNDLENLITLCSTCHHKGIEGKWKESSPEEFKQKAQEYYGVI